MSEHLEEFKPKLRPGIQQIPLPEGAVAIKEPRNGVYCEVEADEAFLLGFMDGSHSVGDLAHQYMQKFGKISIRKIMSLLANLGDRRLLLNPDEELIKLNLLHPAPPENIFGKILRVLTRLEIYDPVTTRLLQKFMRPGMWIGMLGVLGLTVAYAGGRIITTGHREAGEAGLRSAPENLFSVSGSYMMGLIAMILAVMFVQSVRELAKGLALVEQGGQIHAAGFCFTGFVPFLGVDTRDVFITGRLGRRQLAQVGITSYVFTSILGLMFMMTAEDDGSHIFWSQTALVSFIGLLLAICPFLGKSDLSLMIAEMLPGVNWQVNFRSYLHKRLLSRFFRKDQFDNEQVYLVAGIYGLLWFIGALVMLAMAAANYLVRFWIDRGRAPDAQDNAANLILLAMLSLTILLVALAFFWEVMRLLTAGTMEKLDTARRTGKVASTAAVAGDAQLVQELRNIPLFAAMSNADLTQLAHAVELRTYKAGNYIIRQGDQGDEFYSIRRGAVEVRITSNTGLEGTVARLQPGDGFGEIALLQQVPRTASVLATEDTEVFAMKRDDFIAACQKANLSPDKVTSLLRMLQYLKTLDFFRDLSSGQLLKLATQLRPESANPGDYVIRQGEIGNKFYLLQGGEVDIAIGDSPANEKVVASLKPGSYFGEIALLKNIPRTANVKAKTPVQLLSLTKEVFLDIVASNFLMSMNLERTGDRRLQISAQE
ncbi:MAG: hypothetical protein GMKNLPBB_02321 [Myxococcota bacterium]|nr:hypothetical protein [Myxococcota bacterium]